VVTRYDRSFEEETILRVHQEDICQALSFPPVRKYQNEGGPAAADVTALLRKSMRPAIAGDAVKRFADALIWNWLIGGTDAHAKNYSLLLAGRTVRLAPLYDIASALPYGTHERKLRLAMKIGGSYDVYPRRNTWPAAARELGLDPGALLDRVRELCERAPDAFADAAKSPEVLALGRELPSVLSALVGERAARCAKLL
jgi:serine/threonine-protein kinase HipA